MSEETGCKLSSGSRVLHLVSRNHDSGVFASDVHYIVVDQVEAPELYSNPEEGISGICKVPFENWVVNVFNGKYEDISMLVFASLCGLDSVTKSVVPLGYIQELHA